MRLIALLTDFGTKDTYVAEMKAAIFSRCKNVQIIDITHNIEPQNVKQAAFLLSTTYKHLPDETIIVVVVDPGVGTERRMIAATAAKLYFIGPDNGVFNFLNSIPDKEIYTLDTPWYWADTVSSTFHGRDIFAPVAAYVASGIQLNKFGKRINSMKECPGLLSEQVDNQIVGEILWIDNFGNAISNISDENLIYKDNKQEIFIETIDNTTQSWIKTPLMKTFTDAEDIESDKMISYIGSKGYLEFAVNNKSASRMYQLRIGTKVKITIH